MNEKKKNIIYLLLAFGLCVGGCILEGHYYRVDMARANNTTETEIVTTEKPVITVECTSEEVIELTTEETVDNKYLGQFKITAYCPCEKCCGVWAYNRPDGIVYGASGAELIPNYSIGVDPNVIPYGTKVTINGREYIAHDTGGAIDGNHIDIYMSSHEEALTWGVGYYDVYMIMD